MSPLILIFDIEYVKWIFENQMYLYQVLISDLNIIDLE